MPQEQERRRSVPRWFCEPAQSGIYVSPAQERSMNWDEIKGDWKQAKGKVKQQWGKLTDDDLTRAEGKRDELVGKIQERYGIAKDEADKQVKDWESSYR